jgi:hypothetical protein
MSRHHDDGAPGLEQRGLDHVVAVDAVRLGLHDHPEVEAPSAQRQQLGRLQPDRPDQVVLRRYRLAPGGGVKAFYRRRRGLLALGDHQGRDIGWDFQHHEARKLRGIGEGYSGDMRIKTLGNADGKIAGRIARGQVAD